jgi:hypothetical protein
MTKRGVAMTGYTPTDLDTLGAGWYYNWACYPEQLEDPRYVPMLYNGTETNLPLGYNSYVLFLNEPNVQAPYGCDIHPDIASYRYKLATERYPDAKFVVAGVTAWSVDWSLRFRDLIAGCKPPHAYAVHGYVEGWIMPEQLFIWWMQHITAFGKVWVTEFSDTFGHKDGMFQLTNWLDANPMVERYAAFINRATGEEPWYPGKWVNVRLVDDDGALTELGHAYSDKRQKVYMPMINR